jgi:threonine dehydratase
MEILKQMTGKPLHAIFVCCGGGGMLAGIAAYVKRVRPNVLVIGVEAADAAGMTASLRKGRLHELEHVGLFADGAAVRKVGAETFRICNELVDEMVTVSTDEICSAIKDCFMDTRSILEPAGALGIAGLKKWAEISGTRDQTYVAICSGANMNFDSLRFVSERADASETLLSVAIPERPGAFRRLIRRLEPRNVTEFSYRHSGNGSEAAHIYLSFQARKAARKRRGSPRGCTCHGRAKVHSLCEPRRVAKLGARSHACGPMAHTGAGTHTTAPPSLQARGKDDVGAVLRAIKEDGCDALDLTDNELAKDHARHLAGGRSRVDNERIYRFEFPERQGALVNFLDSLNGGNGSTAAPWNVSLFHYRNHGGDVGRVLAGMQVRSEAG